MSSWVIENTAALAIATGSAPSIFSCSCWFGIYLSLGSECLNLFFWIRLFISSTYKQRINKSLHSEIFDLFSSFTAIDRSHKGFGMAVSCLNATGKPEHRLRMWWVLFDGVATPKSAHEEGHPRWMPSSPGLVFRVSTSSDSWSRSKQATTRRQ